jgi:hypothetical protein
MVFFNFFYFFLIFLEATLLALFILFSFENFIYSANAGVGENVTVGSELEIGNTPPIVQSINIEGGTINLNANTTKLVNCSIIAIDYNGEEDIINLTAEIFDNSASGKGQGDDNNEHYTNNTCNIDYAYGDENTVLGTCLFNMWYYSNPGTWNCSIFVKDNSTFSINESDTAVVQELLALEVPSTINYGTINATQVSNENITNVSNVGNVMFNLSFSGYGHALNDNLAMNCTLGNIKNISVEHEKYNLTEPNPGAITLDGANGVYKNLSSFAKVNAFNLDYRTQEGVNEAINTTYWRIYAPLGVAGSCEGNVIFGAVKSAAS